MNLVQDHVPKAGFFGTQQIMKPDDFEAHLPQWKSLSRFLDWEDLGPTLGICVGELTPFGLKWYRPSSVHLYALWAIMYMFKGDLGCVKL